MEMCVFCEAGTEFICRGDLLGYERIMFRVVGCQEVKWIELAQYHVQCKLLVLIMLGYFAGRYYV
jgi:hypothetical protein